MVERSETMKGRTMAVRWADCSAVRWVSSSDVRLVVRWAASTVDQLALKKACCLAVQSDKMLVVLKVGPTVGQWDDRWEDEWE